ncbi:MAG TPA: FtsX-like permease family protein [Vicinamibacteria bacterium]|nr:FtsX-like permease family protein [Vicinamibacteria bacterium]
MTRTLLLTGLRDLARRPLHTGLMVLGVALGVAVVIAIDLANGSAERGFARSTEVVTGRATHEVTGGPVGVPQDLFRRLRAEAGVSTCTPVVDGYAVAVDLDRQPVRVLGLDPLSDAPFRAHLGGGSFAEPGFARLFVDPRAVVVASPLAERYGLRLGSPLRLSVMDRLETLTVAGIAHPARADEATALETVLLLDVGAAQQLFRMGDRVSRVDLIADEADLARVRPLLPPGTRLAAASAQAATVGQLTAAFRLNLTALSLLALVVGMFLIYNTVMFAVVQRRPVLGTLRLLGATPRQVFALVLLETAAAAALGTAFGIGLGWALGQGAVRLVTRTINDLYFVLAVTRAPLTLPAAARAVALGLGAAVLAAVAPALEAARVEPVEALRRSVVEARSHRLLPRLGLGGVLVAIAGGVLLLAVQGSLAASFAGLFTIVMGLALVAPLGTVAAMAALTPLAGRLGGTLGRLATRTVRRSVSRTGVAVAALAVAVSVTIGVGLMIGSFRATVENWLDLTLRADVFVAAPSAGGARAFPTLSPDVVPKLARLPGVAWVESFRSVRVPSPSGEVNLAVADPRRARDTRLYRFAEGDPAQAWDRVRAGAVVVTEPFAFRHRLPRHGATVVLDTDHGRHGFPVAGVFYDYATEQGTVFISRDVYQRFWDDRGVSSLGLHLLPGASLDAVVAEARRAVAGSALLVTPNRALRRQALRVFDRTFAVTQSLRLLAVVVAFIGVWSALMAVQVERRRELATLATLGLTARQQWALTLLETGLMGAVAGALSLPLGGLLAVILVNVINVRSFGWTMRLQLEPGLFVQAVAVSVGAAMLASVYPMLRLRRRSLADALRQE